MRRAIFIFGPLCKKGHDHDKTGFSLRSKQGHCVECQREAYVLRMQDPAKKEHQRQMTKEKGERNKLARRIQSRASYQRNIEKKRAAARAAYYAKAEINRVRSNEYRAKNLEVRREKDKLIKRVLWREKTEQLRAYAREFYAKNHLRIRIRNRVSKALRAQRVHKSFRVGEVGIDIAAIASYIGPCPGVPSDWHIDHIRPLCSFDLSDPVQLADAFKPENHQWLPALENIRKHAKYEPQSSPR